MKRFFCLVGSGGLITAFCCSYLSVRQLRLLMIALFFLFGIICLIRSQWLRTCFSVSKSLILLFISSCLLINGLFIVKESYSYLPAIQFSGTEQRVSAVVNDIHLRSGGRYTYTLKAKQIGDKNVTFPFTFLCYSTKSLYVDYGDLVTMDVTFFEETDHDYFDSSRYNKGQNIYLTCYTDSYTGVISIEEEKGVLTRIFSNIQKLRHSLYDCIKEHLPQKSSSVLGAMILGFREDIPYPLEQDYIASGIIHLLAISGMHVLILSLFAEKIFLFLFRKLPVRKASFTCIGVTIVILFFLILSGMQSSALRSGIMMIVLQLGKLFYRKSDSLNSLFLAGLVIVLQNVYAIMDIGFLMSFSSSLGIILMNKPITEYLVRKLRVYSVSLRLLVENISISISATLFLMPFFIISFRCVSIVAPVTNLVGGILITPILALGFFVTLSSLFLPSEILNLLYSFEEFLLNLLNETATVFSQLPYSSIGMDYRELDLAWIGFIILTAAICFIGRYFHFSKQKLALCCAFGLLVCFSGAFGKLYLDSRYSLEIYFVGDGTTANCVLKSQGQTTVISPNDDDYIDEATASFLRKKGIHKVDNLILLYSSFRSYQDTVNLIQSIPVTNIFYLDHNLDAEFTLTRFQTDNTNLFPINDQLQEIQCGRDGNFSIQFRIISKAAALTISYENYELLFFGTANAALSSEAEILCLRGSDFSKMAGKNAHVVLLNSGKDAEQFENPAYLVPISYTFYNRDSSESFT